jgi:hypothetical protein
VPTSWLRTPLFRVREERELILTKLADTTPAGLVEGLSTRRCDFVALELGGHDDLPAFDPSWPLQRRDEAIAALVRTLKALP